MILVLFLIQKCFSKKSISITSKNIDEITNNPDELPVFIKFWSPYCPHCKEFEPTWNKFSSLCNDECIIADVNCITQSKICINYSIEAYPTLKWVHPSQNLIVEFFNDRTIENLQTFVKIQLSSHFIPIKDISEISTQKSHKNLYVFEYKTKDDNIYKNVYEISKLFNNLKIPVYAVPSNSNRLVFHEFNSSESFKDKKFKKDNLINFFQKHIFSYFNEMKPEFVSAFHLLEKPIILYFLFNPKTTKPILRFNLNSLKPKYIFLYSYYNQTDGSVRDLFTPYSKKESFLVYIDPKTKKYISTKAHMTDENLVSWIKDEIGEDEERKKNWKTIFPSRYTNDNIKNILFFNNNYKTDDNTSGSTFFNLILYLLTLSSIFILLFSLFANNCKAERSPGQPIVDV